MVTFPEWESITKELDGSYDVLIPDGANIDIIVSRCSELPPPGREVRVGPITMHTGGGGALSALGLSRLGLRTAFCGALGDDLFGKYIEDELTRNRIDVLSARAAGSATGVTLAFRVETDRSFVTFDGVSFGHDLPKLSDELLAKCRHVHLASYRGRSNHAEYLAFIRCLRAAGHSVSLDVGWDETGEWFSGIFEILDEINVFFCNEQEAVHFSRQKTVEEALEVFGKHSATTVVKLGPKGAMSVQGSTVLRDEGFCVQVVDTTGAGDSFNAGYVYGWLQDRSPAECLHMGNACGALSVTRRGGSSAFPTREELAQFLAGRHV
jgi:sugar/nucleoside kinase (ribokinase family)